METTNPKTAAKSATLSLAQPTDAVPSTQAPFADAVDRTGQDTTASRALRASRFPTRARDAGREETGLDTKIGGFFSGQDWTESARNAVREHPLAVVGVALVVGLLVGRL